MKYDLHIFYTYVYGGRLRTCPALTVQIEMYGPGGTPMGSIHSTTDIT